MASTLDEKAGPTRKAEEKATRVRSSKPARWVAAVGLSARGAVYLILGYLAADIAVGGGRGKNASSQGALEEVVHQPAGPLLVVLLAVGLAAYAAWRLLQSVTGEPGQGHGKETAQRLGRAGIAVIYVALSVQAVEILAHRRSSNGSATTLSKTLLTHDGGQVVLAALGVGIAAGGLALAAWGVGRDFGDDRHRRNVAWLRTFGNVVRGLAFAGIGASMLAAAVSDNARQAKGLNGSLRTLAAQPYGPALLVVAASGFAAFGLASLVEAKSH